MARFLVLLGLLVSTVSQAAYLPQAETLKTGELTIISPSTNANLKQFVMYAANNGGITTFRLSGSTPGTFYQVPVGKSLRIISATMISGTVGFSIRLGYGDTSVGQNSNVLPTSPLFFGGDGSGTGANGPWLGRVNATSESTINPIGMSVPATKYPFIYWEENTATSAAAYASVYVTAIEE